MNNKDFYDEVLSSEYCPECFSTIYQDFQKYQEMTMNTLKEFHYICEKNEIPYELAYGSLLGAIRHGGSIPWDYDVDVFVPFEYREKLVEVLKKDLKQEFYFYCPESYNTCRHYFIRITPIGMRSEVLHIDVFFLTGVPNSPGEINIYQQEIKKLSKIRFHKLVDIKTESAGSLKRMIRLAIKKLNIYLCRLNLLIRDIGIYVQEIKP